MISRQDMAARSVLALYQESIRVCTCWNRVDNSSGLYKHDDEQQRRSRKAQSSSQLGLGPGGLGPPACLATMIWSTDRTVRAASVASLMAHCLVTSRSRIPSFLASRMPVSSSF